MKWFKKENEKEAVYRDEILDSQQKALKLCVKKISGLIDMRASGEIEFDEFNDRMPALKNEKLGIEKMLNKINDRIDKWTDVANDMFIFVKSAVEKFNTGSLEIRKGILSTLGQKLILKDKKLLIDMENALLPLKIASKTVEQIHEALEMNKEPIKQEELEDSYAKNPILLDTSD